MIIIIASIKFNSRQYQIIFSSKRNAIEFREKFFILNFTHFLLGRLNYKGMLRNSLSSSEI